MYLGGGTQHKTNSTTEREEGRDGVTEGEGEREHVETEREREMKE